MYRRDTCGHFDSIGTFLFMCVLLWGVFLPKASAQLVPLRLARFLVIRYCCESFPSFPCESWGDETDIHRDIPLHASAKGEGVPTAARG